MRRGGDIQKRYEQAADELRSVDVQLEAFETLSRSDLTALRKRKKALEAELKRLRDQMGTNVIEPRRFGPRRGNNLDTKHFNQLPPEP